MNLRIPDFVVGMTCTMAAVGLIGLAIAEPERAALPTCPPRMQDERLASIEQTNDRVTCYYASLAIYGSAPSRIRVATGASQ